MGPQKNVENPQYQSAKTNPGSQGSGFIRYVAKCTVVHLSTLISPTVIYIKEVFWDLMCY